MTITRILALLSVMALLASLPISGGIGTARAALPGGRQSHH